MITCLHHECEVVARTRGLCYSHYNYLCRQVKAGKTTWAALEAEGKCLPAQKSGAKWEKMWDKPKRTTS